MRANRAVGRATGLRLVLAVATTVMVAGCSAAVSGSPVTATSAALGSTASPTPTSGSPVPTSGSVPASSPSASASASGATGNGSTGSGSPGADTGNFPSAPLPLPATASSVGDANLLEARRIAGSVPVPTFVVPAYSDVAGLSTLPLRNADALSVLFPDPMPTVAKRAGLITGFAVSRTDPKTKHGVVLAAFEFASAAAATAAQAPMVAADTSTSAKPGVKIPGFATATGHYYQSDNTPTTSFFLVQGSMMLYVFAESSTEAAALDVTNKMFTAMTKSFASFTPTPPQQIAALPVDQDGMLARTLPEKSTDRTVYAGLYTPDAVIHYFSEPAEFHSDMTTAKVDLVTLGFGQMYRTSDESAASALRDSFIQQYIADDAGQQPYTLTGSFPQVKCLQQALKHTFDCVGAHGRYVWDLPSASEAELRQAVTAQEAMLTGS